MSAARWARALCLGGILTGCGGSGPARPRPTTPPPGCDEIDADRDGVSACEDCDDQAPQVYPGAPDAWYDGVDANCDGADDFDQDGDGDPALDHGGRDCDDTDPLVDGIDHDGDLDSTCAGDCDDSDPTISPWAERVCGDGIDNDCDGLADCHPLGDLELGDLGLPEMLALVPGQLGGFELPAGQRQAPLIKAESDLVTAEIYLMPTDWLGTIDPDDAVATFSGIINSYADVTGDGIPDVINIDDPFSGPDTIRIYPGPHSGTYAPEDAAITLAPTAGSQGNNDPFDHDDDGRYGIFGKTSRAPYNFGAPYEWALYFIDDFVQDAGVESVLAVVHASTEDGILSMLDSTHDMTGDGHPDLVFSDLDTFTTYLVEGPSLTGMHDVADIAAVTITSCSSQRPVGDLNGDGQADLGCGGGYGYRILYGPIDGDRDGVLDADLLIINFDNDAVRAPGDVDGDGNPDLLVLSEPISLYYGPFPSGTVLDPALIPADATFDTPFGSRIAYPFGDTNGDGFADFLIGDTLDGYHLVYGGSSAIF